LKGKWLRGGMMRKSGEDQGLIFKGKPDKVKSKRQI
jgi:hypothetical protein